MSFSQTEARRSEDAELVRACVGGNEKAWETLIYRYQSLIYSVARLYFKNASIADDVFQEVCMELYRRLDTLREAEALPAWLITVSRRKCTKALRDGSKWADLDEGNLPVAIEQKIAGIEKRFWIEKALGQLRERDQALIKALYFEPDQPSYAEIARRLEMPVSSIGPTRARCLQKLREFSTGSG